MKIDSVQKTIEILEFYQNRELEGFSVKLDLSASRQAHPITEEFDFFVENDNTFHL